MLSLTAENLYNDRLFWEKLIMNNAEYHQIVEQTWQQIEEESNSRIAMWIVIRKVQFLLLLSMMAAVE